MFSATLQLFEKLDAFHDLHAVGENPSPNEIREMFALLPAAKAEHAGHQVLRVELDWRHAPHIATDNDDPRGHELTTDEATSAVSAAFARKALDIPTLDEVSDRLQKAVVEKAASRQVGLVHWYRAPRYAYRRQGCLARAIGQRGHRDDVIFTTEPGAVTCPDCRARLRADKRRGHHRAPRASRRAS